MNQDAVALRARNRLAILEADGGSLAFLPPSHKFFFSREIETNLGYVYYRKDSETSFAIGVRQPDREEGYKPYGISDEVWKRRVAESRGELEQLRALQRAARNPAAHAGLFLSEPGGQPRHAAGGDGVHARRRVQADAGLSKCWSAISIST